MLAQAKAVAFVASNDLVRARGFYEGLLGLTVASHDEAVLVLRTAASEVRVILPGEHKAAVHTALGFEVADLAAVVAALKAKGVICDRFSSAQDVDGIALTEDGEKIAWIKDPDGNVITLSQPA